MFLPADCPEWDNVVASAYSLKKQTIEYDGVSFKLFSIKKKPAFYTNAPYLDSGGLTFDDDQLPEELSQQLYKLIEKHHLKYVLLKSYQKLNLNYPGYYCIDEGYCTFVLDTKSGIDDIWKKKLKAKTRNQIRKAEKYGFNVRIGYTELLDDFYRVISRCWRDLGTPSHSFDFYSIILEEFSNKAMIIVLYDKEIPVSTSMIFNIDGVVSNPFAGTLNQYKPTSVNNLLYWTIIKLACDSSASYFDMGRSRINQGTYNFKKSWGGDINSLYYHYFFHKKQSVPSYDTRFLRMATSMWKLMPLTLAKLFGPYLIYRVL